MRRLGNLGPQFGGIEPGKADGNAPLYGPAEHQRSEAVDVGRGPKSVVRPG